MWKLSVLLILGVVSTINGQRYDCDQAPPTSVDPFTCCKISKPFDRKNFPECFGNPILITTTSIPTTSPLPTIPVTELNDDYDYPINNFGYNGNRAGGSVILKNEKRRNGGNNRYNNNNENYYRGDSSNNNVRGTSNRKNKENNENDDNEDNYHWKHHDHNHGRHHWGWQNHRFGGYHGSRHRRQAIFQPSAFRNQCALECIFNQTNILSNGRFDRDIALEVYADYYPEVPIDLLTRTIDKCSNQLRKYRLGYRRKSRKPNHNKLLNRQCRNGSGLFATCFNQEIYRNCPTELDSNSEDCLTLRSFVDNCSPVRGTREIGSTANVDVDEYGNIILDDPLN